MKTEFTPQQLTNPLIAETDRILRKCVHCGFCTATCPTFKLLGDELDSPRGRIYLIKNMLEGDKPATAQVVKHVDRCLTCLSCMTTCPSGVDYMHLVDGARGHIEKTYKRPFLERFVRAILSKTLPFRNRFRWSLKASFLAKPLLPVLRLFPDLRQIVAMLELAPSKIPAKSKPMLSISNATNAKKSREKVILMEGCAQPVLAPQINESVKNLLGRLGFDVIMPEDEGCCGALVHHMGLEENSRASARANIDAWWSEIESGSLEAILISASGCGTAVKDYAHLLQHDSSYAQKAAKVSILTRDICEFLNEIGLGKPLQGFGLTIAYHSACSMQHGQKITSQPIDLLTKAGFKVLEVPQKHLCCGSAGVYNILQPALAKKLRENKLANILSLNPDIIATGNIGCIAQLASGTTIPVVHTAELLDWVYGGPKPLLLG